jgi:hypothetical protein
MNSENLVTFKRDLNSINMFWNKMLITFRSKIKIHYNLKTRIWNHQEPGIQRHPSRTGRGKGEERSTQKTKWKAKWTIVDKNWRNSKTKLSFHGYIEVMFFVVADGSQGNTKQIPILLCLFLTWDLDTLTMSH